MNLVDVLGAFMAGIITIAALSLIVAPNSEAANTIKAFGEAASGLVQAAKK